MTIKDILPDIGKRTKIFPPLLASLAFISCISFWALLISFSSITKKEEEIKPYSSPFLETTISAKSAYVIDMDTGTVLYEKNADEPLPLASVTKLMTVLTTKEIASGMKYVAITDNDLLPEGDSGLLANTLWGLQNLIDYSLIVSSNDGASALARAAGAYGNKMSSSTPEEEREQFVKNMNALAQTLGLTSSKFFNEHGLDIDLTHVGAIGSAKDMATLLSYILNTYPRLLEATKYPSLRLSDEQGLIYTALNTNISINEIPSLIASKTGFTDLAGGNLVIAFDAGLGRPIIISVLGSTKEKRFEDVLTLASTTLQYFKLK